ncbi:hypothetical protein BDW75DRAFT_203435, partial [Aspergillus navahoensis]
MSGAAHANVTATAAAVAGPGGGAYAHVHAHVAAHGARNRHQHGHEHDCQDRRYGCHDHASVDVCGGRCTRVHHSYDRGGGYCPEDHCGHRHGQEQEIHRCVSVGPAGMRHDGRGCGGDCEGETGESWHQESYVYGPPLPPVIVDVGRGGSCCF